MTTRSISELALATISEIDRRGLQRGALAQTQVFDKALNDYVSVPAEDCKVCLLGAMSSAYNPFHPEVPGYNDGDPGGQYDDAGYQKFIDAVLDEVYTDDTFTKFYRHPRKVATNWAVATWHDQCADADADVVKAMLQRVAEKHQ